MAVVTPLNNFLGPEGATGTRSAALARGWTTQSVCVFITAGPITKLFAGGRRRVDDMCYDRRRAKACVDESARHALANAGGREIVGKKELIPRAPKWRRTRTPHPCV